MSEGLHSVAARVRCVCFGMAVLVGSLWATALAAEPEVDVTKAAKVKAAYLRYIAEFTTWPPEVLGNDEEPIVLGTMGTDPHGVAEILESAIERKGLLAQSRPLVLRRLPDPRDAVFEAALADCHLLFMTPGSDDDAAEWGRLRTLLADRPIVTVGEISGFSQAAGMIEFVINPADSRVTMHIDLEAVQRANLRLSSRLLGLKQGVKIVRTPLATGACASASCVDRLRNARIDPGVLGSLDQERHPRLAPGPDR